MRTLAMALAAVMLPATAMAGTLTVGAGQQHATLVAAVTAATSGDTILVSAGTYTVNATINVAKSLTIRGTGGTPVFQASGVEILHLASGTTTVDGLDFRPSGQRAIRISGGVVTLDGVDVSGNNNSANVEGAAVQVDGVATVTIKDSTFRDSTARGGNFLLPTYGGCLYVDGGDVRIQSSTFDMCRGQYGGAAALITGTLVVEDSTFTGNVAGSGYDGGAIYASLGTELTVTGSTFDGNVALGNGGALELNGRATVTGSVFENNRAGNGTFVLTSVSGGAIYAYCDTGCPSVTVEDSSFHANSADGQGGAAYFATPGVVRFVGNTVCDNTATEEGGGVTISSRARSWTLTNNVFDANTAIDGAAIQCNESSDGTGASASGGRIVNNDFLGNTPSSGGAVVALGLCSAVVRNDLFVSNTGTAFKGGTGGFDYNLWFRNGTDVSGRTRGSHDLLNTDPRLAGWSNDGDCANDSYDLGAGSPAINSGDPAILDPDGTRSDIGLTGGPDAPQTVDADGDSYTAGRDCDDSDPTIHPGVPETCDGVDEDCDGEIDQPAPASASTWYRDADGDGRGRADSTVQACDAPAGFAAIGDDCNDGDADVFPGSPEFCDGIDNDCDGLIDGDDADDLPQWYTDRDGDGFGRPAANPQTGCEAPEGTVANDEDCDDGNASVSPDAAERCDGVDEDCDGKVDNQPVEGITFWKDDDGDGWGDDDGRTVDACHPPGGFVNRAGDCDDGDRDVHPLATEPCDPGRDLNCDGAFGSDDNDSDGYPACEDCDDFNSDAYPGAGDDWYDGVITNCDHLSDYDRDGDAEDAFEGGGYDCDDKDRDVYPGATDIPDDDVDQDCDGDDAETTGGPGGPVVDDTDSGEEPSKLACRGCTSTGGIPLWPALLVLAAVRRRRLR